MRSLVTEATILRVYHETLEPLYAYVSRRCDGERAVAEDVVQEAWLRAVRAWRHEGLPRLPLAWLKTVARNVLLNRMRRRPALSLDEVPDALLLAAAGAGDGESSEATGVLHQALARLPRNRASLLEQFHLHGRSTAEIAAAEGVSERAVEGRLRRARQALRTEVESILEAQGEAR